MMDFVEPNQLPSDGQELLGQPLVGGEDGAKANVWRARLALYSSHALAAWGQRSWEFAVGLLMLRLRPHNLTLVSAYGLADSLGQVLLGASVGTYLDRRGRLQGATQMYMLQNTGVLLSAAAIFPLLSDPTGSKSGDPGGSPLFFWALTAASIACGATASVGSMGSTLAVERQWTKALCRGDTTALAAMNSGMRRIDLAALIVSPMVVGALMTYGSSALAALVICMWNLLAWAPECALLRYSMQQAPWLIQYPRGPNEADMQPASSSESDGPLVLEVELGDRKNWAGRCYSTLCAAVTTVAGTAFGGWRVYCLQPVLPAALALAMLYLTVMSLGLLMTAFLKAEGMSEVVLSLFRGLGAASGVAATFTFPALQRHLGLVRTAMLGIWLQAASLWAGVTPLLLNAAAGQAVGVHKVRVAVPVATHVLVSGVAASRWGLWTFDLAVSQLLQERVPDDQLNVVAGVQGSLQSLFGLTTYAATLLAPTLSAFPWLMAASCGIVTAAALLVSCSVPALLAPASVPQHVPPEADI